MGLASKLNQAAGPATTGQINANQMKTTNSSLNLGIWTKNTTTVDTFNNVPGTAVPGATPLPYQTGGMVQAAPGSYPQQQQQQYPATYPHQQQFYPAHVQQVPMQAGAPPPYADPFQPAPRYTGPYRGDIIGNLRRIVAANKLQTFYNDAHLQQLASQMATMLGVNASRIESAFGIPGLAGDISSMEDVAVFSAIGLYDVVLYVDDSGSIEYYNKLDGRKDDLMMLIDIICNIVTVYDSDGISLRFFNSDIELDGVRSTADVKNAISRVKFNGTTPLGTNLDKRIIQKHIVGPARSNRLPKPVLVIVLTDGQPEGEEGNNPRKVFDVIRNCKSALKSTRYGEKAAAFQFVQLGRDQGAQRFLAELDNDPVVGEHVDCTSSFEMEAEEVRQKGNELEVGFYVYKLLTGSIDPEMDAMD